MSISRKITILAVLAFMIWGILSVVSYFQFDNRVSLVGDTLSLKAPPERIVQYTEYDEFGRPLAEPSEGANNNLIKYSYATEVEVPPANYEGVKEDISKRTPNAQLFLKSVEPINEEEVKETYVGKFYSNVTFDKRGNKWYQVESATTTKTAFNIQTKPTVLTQVKQFLGQPALADDYFAGTGDGWINHRSSTVWATTHDAATGGAVSSVDAPVFNNVTAGEEGFGSDWEIDRLFLPFDTSAISSGAAISAVSLNVYVNSTSTAGDLDTTNNYINVVQTTQPSSATLTTADYDLCGDAISNPTTGATNISIHSGFTAPLPAYTAFTLNATGLTWVKKSGESSTCGGGTGVTCLGLREGHDITNTEPNPIAGGTSGITVIPSEATGTSQDPYLTVTFSVASPALRINGGTLKINGGTLKVN
ncbi:MAG: hypothetical protein KBC48_00730 [Candidatus Pacebacteria bacterium]|nr:hypothetical protein [Candidatus Paceibacterota bacterium]